MKKLLLSLIIFFSFCIVVSADTLTITYDANDGSGRTKVVEFEKGDSYEIAGNDIFEQINNNPDDPMDDRIISRWTLNPDNSDFGYSLFITINRIDAHNNIDSDWTFLNNQTEVTLYAKWDERDDISDLLTVDSLTGDGVVQNENGEYSVLEYGDFTYFVSFKEIYKVVYDSGHAETVIRQMGQLSYYRLPEYFIDNIPFYIKKEFEKPLPFLITVTASSRTYRYIGSYYIKDNILYIDIIKHGDDASRVLYSVNNVNIRFIYGIKWEKVEVNNEFIYSATITYINGVTTDSVEVYQQGRIITRYIDIDTGEKLSDDGTSEGIVHNQFIPEAKEFENYELVESPEDKNYYYEPETQTLYFKYRKKKVEEPTPEEPTPEEPSADEPSVDEPPVEEPKKEEEPTKEINKIIEEKKEVQENPNTGTHLPIVVLLISIILLLLLKLIKRKISNYN